jgi:hypothetical protein
MLHYLIGKMSLGSFTAAALGNKHRKTLAEGRKLLFTLPPHIFPGTISTSLVTFHLRKLRSNSDFNNLPSKQCLYLILSSVPCSQALCFSPKKFPFGPFSQLTCYLMKSMNFQGFSQYHLPKRNRYIFATVEFR